MNENDVEAEIQAKGLTAPRITPAILDSLILATDYHVPSGTTLTLCTLILNNGFTVVGKAACADPKNFDKSLGRKIAYDNARNEIWALAGYELKQRLHDYQYQANFSTPSRTTDTIAQLCHEVNRVWCSMNGDLSQPSWADAPNWQKQSAADGVLFHMDNPDAGDSASHDNWSKMKLADGWVWGEVKDPDAKTHHCLVPFEKLPKDQQIKDALFRSIVHAVLG